MNFDTFSFDARIAAGIRSAGYEKPTPIQSRAIPEVLAGRDVMGLAQTGTGKTAAFALPILQRLVDSGAPKAGPVRTLILAPTRELAQQIHDNFVQLGRQTGIRSATVFGGVGFAPQIKAARKATIIVACPGRLLDLMQQGVIRLDKVDTLVLDEADRMMDMGFMPDIRRIIAALPRERQNLLFSATMPPDIRKLADSILHDPATVQVANTSPVESISHEFYPVRQHLKTGLLHALLENTEHESVLIFTRTKHKAKTLARKLDRDGYKATFLQGNMTQNQRQRALDGFRKGTFQVMVATDIAARGIDCERISHVINFDAPDTAETYTHRIGRTGRAGRSGCALSLMTRDDQRLMREIERLVRARIERCTVDGFDYDERDTRPPSNGGHGNGNGRPARNAKAQHKGRPGNRPSRRKGKPRQAAR